MLLKELIEMYILQLEASNEANPPLYRWSCWNEYNTLKKKLKKEGKL